MFNHFKNIFRSEAGNVPVISVFIVFGICVTIFIIVGLVKIFS